MAAYVISEVEVRDPAVMERYRALAAPSITQYGGRYLVRAGAAELKEGGPPPKTLVIVEFPSMARAQEWYTSSEYGEALKVRQRGLGVGRQPRLHQVELVLHLLAALGQLAEAQRRVEREAGRADRRGYRADHD